MECVTYFDLNSDVWQDVDSLERYDVADISSLVRNVADLDNDLYYTDSYVLYHQGEPVYARGEEGGLFSQLEVDFALDDRTPKKSDLFRRVAEELNIAFAETIKQGKHRLADDEVVRIREWLDGCEIAFLQSRDGNAQGLASRLARVRLLELQRDQFSQDARDRIAAETERLEYKRKRKWFDYAAVAVGMTLASIIGARLLYPLNFTDAPHDYAWLGGESILQFILGLFLAAWVVIPLCAWAAGSKEWKLSRSTPVIVLVLPAILLGGWLIFLRADHERQKEGFAAFDRYFQRVPDSKLGTPFFTYANQFDKDLTTICADLGKQDSSDYICAELDLDRSKGKQITGGFQTRYIESDSYEGSDPIIFYEGHDCWGTSLECDE